MNHDLIARARRAFRALHRGGLLVSTNGCCGPCIARDLTDRFEADPDAPGAAWSSADDRAHARRHGVLSVRFTSGAGEDEGDVAIGHLVQTALAEAGLDVTWPGTPDDPIEARLPREGGRNGR